MGAELILLGSSSNLTSAYPLYMQAASTALLFIVGVENWSSF